MRRTTRLALVVLSLALLPLASCGGSGKSGTGSEGISFGAVYYAIPYLDPIFETEIIGFKNLTQTATTVDVTAFTALGALAGPTPVAIPAQGEVRLPVESFLGGLSLLYVGGWLMIDTTGPATGRVSTYIDRRNTLNESSEAGATFRSGSIAQSLSRFCQSYQIINMSDDGGGTGVDLTYEVKTYNMFGTLVSTEDVDVIAGAAVTRPNLFPGNVVGQVVVTAKEHTGGGAILPTDVLMTSISSKEVQSSVLTEARLIEGVDSSASTRAVGYDIDYGFDIGGNAHDFVFSLSNPTSTGQIVTLDSILTADGTQILPAPRQLLVDPYDTKSYRERTVDCLGLDTGEVSPFDDLFADLDTDPVYQPYTFVFSVPTAVNASMRNYDSLFGSFFRVLPSTSRLSTRVNVTNIPTQTTTASGERNWIDISNPFAGAIEVYPTVTTPGGTRYVLDPVIVGAGMRERFSPDGIIFREIPFDPLSPPVPFISVDLAGAGGLFYNARKTTRNAQDLILFLRPSIVRNETFD